jgi:DNA modification methylase
VTWEIRQGDALEQLRKLDDESFQCCVTSPPYYWARDYEVDGQMGHEDSPEAFVDALAAVFDEIKRVLAPRGVAWLNLGDTYYSGNGQPRGSDPRSPSRNFMRKKIRAVDISGMGIPKKSLLGIPWRVALELQQRGWTLRSDIIWNRVNAFTEPSAKDRPHRQHEHVFLLSKSRWYDFDRDALDGFEDVWNIPAERGNDHCAAFPEALAERCILTGSSAGDTVLDPFCGSATTGLVATRLDRDFIGIELNPEYVELGRRRIQDDAPLLNTPSEIAA